MKNKKILVGLGFGAVAGIIDVIPMVMQGLTWDANISAFALWVISGFLIATSNLKIHSALKGLIISALVLAPAAILIGWQEPFSLIPMGIMTVILGSLSGYFIEKFGQ
ncbi:MAG: hypothetical protein ABID38_05290 [Candidatus Diapherotrites archaeon]